MTNKTILLLTLTLSGSLTAVGSEHNWTFPASNQNWSESANWTPAGAPNSADSNAVFNLGSGSASLVYVDGNYTVGDLTFTASGGRMITFSSPTELGSYTLNITGTLKKSANSNSVTFVNHWDNRNLHVRINNFDFNTNGGSYSFGRSDGQRTITSLEVNNTTIGGTTTDALVSLNVASDYKLGSLTFTGTNKKSVYLINNGSAGVYNRKATVNGISQGAAVTNATIAASQRETAPGTSNVATLHIHAAEGSSYSAGTILEDGVGGVLNLHKDGKGTQILTGSLTYSGLTVVEEGTLTIRGSLGGNNQVEVHAGASFGIANAISVRDLRLEGNAILGFHLDAGSSISVSGDLRRLGVGTGGFVIDFQNTGTVGQNYDGIIALATSSANDFSGLNISYINFGGQSLSGTLTFEQLTNGFAIIPEASAFGYVLLLPLIVLARSLSKRRKLG